MKGKMRKTLFLVAVVVAGLALLLSLGGCGGKGAAAAGGGKAAAAAAPKYHWRLQTYAGPVLAKYVCTNAIEEFNIAANNEMKIDVYTADELVPQGELFQAVQKGTVDAAQSDDDSMASPADIAVFAAYFPLATRYGIDVDVLFNHYGLNEIWKEAYDEIDGVTWLAAGSWDPVNFVTTKPIRSLKDLKGLRVYAFPTGGKFVTRFGVVPMTVPYEDVEMSLQTGILDGVFWCGYTETATVGWQEVTKYFLTNPFCGGWIGSWFVNTKAWEKVPPHLQQLFKLAIDKSNYYRLHWYFWGEANYRAKEGKLTLTSLPESDMKIVEQEAVKFWDEYASRSPRSAKIVAILKEYNANMIKAGPPYRY
jgi:TRAP-type mannitol/chloroaromatic compound transport system substrate-binding protein